MSATAEAKSWSVGGRITPGRPEADGHAGGRRRGGAGDLVDAGGARTWRWSRRAARPPQAAEAPEVRVPVVTQVSRPAPGHWTPLSTAADPP